MSEILNVSPAWLMGYDVPMLREYTETIRDKINKRLDLLNNNDLEKVLTMLETLF